MKYLTFEYFELTSTQSHGVFFFNNTYSDMELPNTKKVKYIGIQESMKGSNDKSSSDAINDAHVRYNFKAI